jgi:hypothetical protein
MSMHMESGPQRHRIVVLLKPRPDFYRSEFASGTDTLFWTADLEAHFTRTA